MLVAFGLVAQASGAEPLHAAGVVALVLASLNLILGAANLVPAYPLDGGRVVRAVFWARTGDEKQGARAAATWVGSSAGCWSGWAWQSSCSATRSTG